MRVMCTFFNVVSSSLILSSLKARLVARLPLKICVGLGGLGLVS
jgi:hypothetical protein